MASLRIPERSREALAQLASLEDVKFSELEKALDVDPPHLYRANLAACVQEKVSLPGDTASTIVRVLLDLAALRATRNVALADFVRDVVESLKEDKETAPQSLEWENLEKRINRLLAFDQSIGITAKSLIVMHENQYVYLSKESRVVTEVRPIFPDDVSIEPSVAVIVHSLKLTYVTSGQRKEIFISLDNRDLQELRKVLDRADAKAKTLRAVLRNAKLHYLDPEVEELEW